MLRFHPSFPALVAAVSAQDSSTNTATICSVSVESIPTTRIVFTPVSRLPETAPIKAFDWAPSSSSSPALFAFASSSGRIAAAQFSSDPAASNQSQINSLADSTIQTIAEYSVKPSRQCHILAFNPTDPSLLLSGLGKYRAEPSIVIWNTPRPSTLQTPTPPSTSTFALSESLNSAAWFTPSTFLAGLASKWIRLYDLRSPSSTSSSTSIATRAVHAISPDPFNPLRFASFGPASSTANDTIPTYSNVVLVWDVRKTAAPVLELNVNEYMNNTTATSFQQFTNKQSALNNLSMAHPVPPSAYSVSGSGRLGGLVAMGHGIADIQWSPTRRGVIAASAKDGDGVVVWELVEALESVGNNKSMERDESVVHARDAAENHDGNGIRQCPVVRRERAVRVCAGSSCGMTAFAWIPKEVCGDRAYEAIVSLHALKSELRETVLTHAPVSGWGRVGEETRVVGVFGGGPGAEVGVGGGEWEDARVFRKRAIEGYGVDAQSNVSVLTRLADSHSSETALIRTWKFLYDRKHGLAASCTIYNKDYTLLGISQLITDSILTQPTTPVQKPSVSLEPVPVVEEVGSDLVNYLQSVPVCEFRSVALRMCGRVYDGKDDGGIEKVVEALEAKGDVEEACGVALFYGAGAERAVEALNRSKDDRLRLVAATLAGVLLSSLPQQKSPLWQQMCKQLGAQLKNVYLKAMFALLSRDGDWQSVILDDTVGLELLDQIALAVRFLPDAQLFECIQNLTASAIERGLLEGLLLTGFTNPPKGSVNLLERYIDVTGDFQSACLISVMCYSEVGGVCEDRRVEEWFENYRNCLDCWELYRERANLDMALAKLYRNQNTSGMYPLSPNDSTIIQTHPYLEKQSAPQLHIRCNFCNAVISHAVMFGASSTTSMHPPTPILPPTPKKSGVGGGVGVTAGPGVGIPTTPFNPNACLHCKKPLPRCCICLMYMRVDGVGVGGTKGLDGWFTWCQRCRHGGHAKHIGEWFETHDVCAVAGCMCVCK